MLTVACPRARRLRIRRSAAAASARDMTHGRTSCPLKTLQLSGSDAIGIGLSLQFIRSFLLHGVGGRGRRPAFLIRCDLAEFTSECPSRPPWTNHPPTVRACGWHLQGPWLDHRSPATAYGLTRCACRTALLVGVDAIQSKTKPSGPSPEVSGAVRQPPMGQSALSGHARARTSLHA